MKENFHQSTGSIANSNVINTNVNVSNERNIITPEGSKTSKNKNVSIIVTYTMLIINFIINIILLCLTFPRSSGLGFDYIGVLIAIISLLVVVLLGWNIYTLIDVKSIKTEYNRIAYEIDLEKHEREFDYRELKSMVFSSMATMLRHSYSMPLQSLEYYTYALYNQLLSRKDEKRIDKLLTKMEEISKYECNDDCFENEEVFKDIVRMIKEKGGLSSRQLDRLLNIRYMKET